MSDPYFVLNRNEGVDTVHRNPREECNLDDAKDRQKIDIGKAISMIANEEAVPCKHCIVEWRMEEPSSASS